MRNFQGIIFKCLSDFLLFKLLIDPVASKKTVCIDKSSYISVGFSLEYEALDNQYSYYTYMTCLLFFEKTNVTPEFLSFSVGCILICEPSFRLLFGINT